MGHEFDGEDILGVACANTRVEGERTDLRLRIIRPNVQVRIIRARGEEVARFRPTVSRVSSEIGTMGPACLPQSVDTSCMAAEFIDDIELVHLKSVSIQSLDRTVTPLLPSLPT